MTTPTVTETRRHGHQIGERVELARYTISGGVVVGYSTPGGGLANTSFWALSGILPFAVGRTLAARSAMTRELEEAATRLQDEQDVRAQLAAAAERAKMARELHDDREAADPSVHPRPP